MTAEVLHAQPPGWRSPVPVLGAPSQELRDRLFGADGPVTSAGRDRLEFCASPPGGRSAGPAGAQGEAGATAPGHTPLPGSVDERGGAGAVALGMSWPGRSSGTSPYPPNLAMSRNPEPAPGASAPRSRLPSRRLDRPSTGVGATRGHVGLVRRRSVGHQHSPWVATRPLRLAPRVAPGGPARAGEERRDSVVGPPRGRRARHARPTLEIATVRSRPARPAERRRRPRRARGGVASARRSAAPRRAARAASHPERRLRATPTRSWPVLEATRPSSPHL